MAALQRDYGNKWREKLAQNTNQTTVSNSQDANCVQQNSDTGKKDSQKSDVTASQADKKELFNKWKEEGNSHVKLVRLLVARKLNYETSDITYY